MDEALVLRFNWLRAEYERVKGHPSVAVKWYAATLVREMEAIAAVIAPPLPRKLTRWQRLWAWISGKAGK